MIQILDACTTSLVDCCSDAGFANIFYITKKVLLVIQVLVPIFLIVSVIFGIIKLLAGDPDDKKNKKSIVNRVIAAVVIFFLPMVINLTLSVLANTGERSTYNITDCWTNAEKVYNETRDDSGTGKPDPNQPAPSSIVTDEKSYE